MSKNQKITFWSIVNLKSKGSAKNRLSNRPFIGLKELQGQEWLNIFAQCYGHQAGILLLFVIALLLLIHCSCSLDYLGQDCSSPCLDDSKRAKYQQESKEQEEQVYSQKSGTRTYSIFYSLVPVYSMCRSWLIYPVSY